MAESQKTLQEGPVAAADQCRCPRGNDREQAAAEQGQAAWAQQQPSAGAVDRGIHRDDQQGQADAEQPFCQESKTTAQPDSQGTEQRSIAQACTGKAKGIAAQCQQHGEGQIDVMHGRAAKADPPWADGQQGAGQGRPRPDLPWLQRLTAASLGQPGEAGYPRCGGEGSRDAGQQRNQPETAPHQLGEPVGQRWFVGIEVAVPLGNDPFTKTQHRFRDADLQGFSFVEGSQAEQAMEEGQPAHQGQPKASGPCPQSG